MKLLTPIALLAWLLAAPALAQTPTTQAASPAPAPALSRAEFVGMVTDHFGWVHWSDYIDYAKPVPRRFHDVQTADRFGKQIESALEEGILPVGDDNRFYPGRPINRQDAATILADAFRLPAPPEDVLRVYADAGAVTASNRRGVGALIAAGIMKGRTPSRWEPSATLTRQEASALLQQLAAARVAPVQAMPKSGTTSYRRAVNLTTPTPGATIHYTMTDDHTEPPDPTDASKVYDPAKGYLNLDNPQNATTDQKFYTIKAVAMKNGVATSSIRTFFYHVVRPLSSAFEARLVHTPTATSPAVWDIWNPSDYNRPHSYLIEGTTRGVMIDAGQYPEAKQNMKSFVDTVATRPYDVVLGHNNPDHVEQIDAFVKAGVRLYLTPQDKASVAASKREDFQHAAANAVLIHDGDVLDLGNVQMTAYQVPGHENGLVILQEKRNGWVFGTDMFGCNRPATADITNYAGAKMDVFLSILEQLYARLRTNGRVTEVYNAHQETFVGYPGILNFKQSVQQLIDRGDAAASPSLRSVNPGGQPFPKPQRMSIVGDMWRNRDWIAIWVGGFYGDPMDYLSKPDNNYGGRATIDYNAAGGLKKYSVLSNLAVAGGTLAGVDLAWAPPANGQANSLPNMFDPWTYAYDVTVPAASKALSITPTAMSTNVTSLKVDGVSIKSGTARTVAVDAGTRVTVDVVAPDGVTTSHYVLTVKR